VPITSSSTSGIASKGIGVSAAWLPSLALTIHVLEELSRFPAWATLRFGTTTPKWFAISHVPIFVMAFWISWRASRSPSTPTADWWLLAFVAALLTNGLFHIAALISFREYSPGVVSSVLLYIPMSVRLVPPLMRRLGRSGARAVFTGVVLAAVATGSLWLDVSWGA